MNNKQRIAELEKELAALKVEPKPFIRLFGKPMRIIAKHNINDPKRVYQPDTKKMQHIPAVPIVEVSK